MNNNNGFFENVYCVVRKIPHGKVSTYGAIANFLGSGKSARAVGWAMNSCHKFKDISASSIPTLNPISFNVTAIFEVIVDFPTPPLADEIAIIFFTEDNFSLSSIDSGFLATDLKSIL